MTDAAFLSVMPGSIVVSEGKRFKITHVLGVDTSGRSSRAKLGGFVPIQIEPSVTACAGCTLVIDAQLRLECATLPGVDWLAALSDPDAIPYTDAEWEAAKPTIRRGRPPAAVTKERITIGLSRDVVEQFRATGEGWQTRTDAALKDCLKTRSPV